MPESKSKTKSKEKKKSKEKGNEKDKGSKNDSNSRWERAEKLPHNLLTVGSVSEETVMAILKTKYQRDLIYTLIGDVLIGLNPFKAVIAPMEPYKGNRSVEAIRKLPPHSYQTAAVALFKLQNGDGNQSVITSGESGAGKTETTKLILNLLISSAGAGGAGATVRDKLMSSNSILESFGNAKTGRNNNSSRFGKWMAIRFDKNYKLLGANVINYLLENTS